MSFSESLIKDILNIFNINCANGVYDLNTFRSNSKLHHFHYGNLEQITFKDNRIDHFTKEHLIEIIGIWVNKVSTLLIDQDIELLQVNDPIRVFYSYVQWGNILGTDNRVSLNNYLVILLTQNQESVEIKRNFCKNFIDTININDDFRDSTKVITLFDNLFGSDNLKNIIEVCAAF